MIQEVLEVPIYKDPYGDPFGWEDAFNSCCVSLFPKIWTMFILRNVILTDEEAFINEKQLSVVYMIVNGQKVNAACCIYAAILKVTANPGWLKIFPQLIT